MKTFLLSFLALQALYLDVNAIVVEKPHPGGSFLGELAIAKVVRVDPPDSISNVTHDKEKNGGYVKGSPLYEKQEALKDSGDYSEPKPPPSETSGVPVMNDVPTVEHLMKDKLKERLVGASVYAVLVLIVAYFYWKNIVPPLGMRAKGEVPMDLPSWTRCGFAYSICDFGNMGTDKSICLTALCCPVIQWAATASRSVSPFMRFWPAVIFALTMTILAPFTLGLTGFIFGIALWVSRRKLRKAYGHNTEDGKSMCQDFCLIFCCPSWLCCQLVQEAREVEYNSSGAPQLPATSPGSVPGTLQPTRQTNYGAPQSGPAFISSSNRLPGSTTPTRNIMQPGAQV